MTLILCQMLMWTTHLYTKSLVGGPIYIPNALIGDPFIYQMLLWGTHLYTKCSCGGPIRAEPPVYAVYETTPLPPGGAPKSR